jgi:tetratricopeptide (TPR) repeat protein
MLAGIAALAVQLWRRNQRPALFLLAWTVLALTPSFAILVKIPAAPVAERYLYLPSAGFCLLVGYAAARAFTALHGSAARRLCAAAFAVVLAAAAVATVRRNAVWRSNFTLWEDTSAKNTTDGLPLRSLGTAYQEAGDADKAAQYYREALQRRNDALGLFTIHNNLGSLAMTAGDLDEAERQYRQAQVTNPHAPDLSFNLALIEIRRATRAGAADSERRMHAAVAKQQLLEAQRWNPHDADIALALGQALALLDDGAAARASYEHALQLGLLPQTAASVRAELERLR